MVELESGKRTSEKEQEERRLREEQTKEPTVMPTLLGQRQPRMREPWERGWAKGRAGSGVNITRSR